MHPQKIYDLAGIGIGPFNLGLAALCTDIEALSCLFLDENLSFDWHPGMLLPGARMQVPFHADLVTLANPCSRYSYLAFLQAQRRLFRFTIRERYFPLRREYNAYCGWVAGQLPALRFHTRCNSVSFDAARGIYRICATDLSSKEELVFFARHIVSGIGSAPYVPPYLQKAMSFPFVLHSGEYLAYKDALLWREGVTVVGSGQSAAEVFYDLLNHYPAKIKKLGWFTRSGRIFPMDYSKFALEMTSPGYIDHFFGLGERARAKTLPGQDDLYKGVNLSLLEDIYERLYLLSLDYPDLQRDIVIHPNCTLQAACDDQWSDGLKLSFFHNELQQAFAHKTGAVVLATGYRQRGAYFLEPVKELLAFDEEGRYAVQRNYSIDKAGKSIFVQNAELHTHGFNAADLGLGPYRNAVILNSILGYEHFVIENDIAFQHFGIPKP